MKALPEISLTVGTDMIEAYAELTDDFNPLHLDPAFAATTAMGTVIAHGTMSINLIWQSLIAAFGPSVLTQCELDIKFVKPVRVGETILSGGSRRDADSGAGSETFDVWVRGTDGDNRLVGQVAISR